MRVSWGITCQESLEAIKRMASTWARNVRLARERRTGRTHGSDDAGQAVSLDCVLEDLVDETEESE